MDLVELANASFGPVAKAEEKASRGRLAAGTVFSGSHGLIAGKKGHKLRAAGNEWGGSTAGSIAGGVVGTAPARALAHKYPVASLATSLGTQTAGAYTGANLGTRRAQRMGHYKPQTGS